MVILNGTLKTVEALTFTVFMLRLVVMELALPVIVKMAEVEIIEATTLITLNRLDLFVMGSNCSPKYFDF